MNVHDILAKQQQLIRIGVELSSERDHDKLLEDILFCAKSITSADGGTLYTTTPDRKLHFAILRTDSLHLHLGGGSGNAVSFPDIPLYTIDGEENLRNVVTYAAHKEVTVNIPDAYQVQGFDFSGTRDFDARTGYRTRSLLNVPLKNHVGTVIGVLQLLNAKDRSGECIPFSPSDQELVESLASQAAVAMTNQRLIHQLNEMLEGFIKSLAHTIDQKSEHTGSHCRRVPVIARMLADAVNQTGTGPFGKFRFTDEELHELDIAALLHDCGKVATPAHVMDKSTRLERVVERMDWIQERAEILRRDFEIAYLKKEITSEELNANCKHLERDIDFLRVSNQPETIMTPDRIHEVIRIGQRSWTDGSGTTRTFLTPDEIENFSITRGTLNHLERGTIEDHVVHTIELLNNLTYPDHLLNVPEIAGGHHERMDGSGYPHGLTARDLSLRARILAIADIFEALTSPDRPYKKPLRLSQAMSILEEMRDENQIDPDLYEVFVNERVFEGFAQGYLQQEQIDI